MSRTVTGATLISRIRSRIECDSAYLSDATLLDWINLAICELQDLILQVNPDFSLTQSYVTQAVGTQSYALPATFYAMRSVDVLDESGDWVELGQLNWSQRYDDSYPASSRASLRYLIAGDNILFCPAPHWSTASTIQLSFYPVLADLVLTGSPTPTTNGINGWDDYVTNIVCAEVAISLQEDPAPFFALAERRKQLILSRASTRNIGRPKVLNAARKTLRRSLPRP